MTTGEQQALPQLDTPFVDAAGHIGIPWYKFLIAIWNRTGGASGDGGVPVGTILDWPGTTPPDGYDLADGGAISRLNNPILFSVCGVTWGAGDGVSTFNKPNLIDRVTIGAGGTYAVGQVGGASSVTILVANLPSHRHGITDPGHTHIQDPHSHPQNVNNNNVAGVAGAQGGNAVNNVAVGTTGNTTATNQTATTGITQTDLTGGGDDLDITPPFGAVLKIIKLG